MIVWWLNSEKNLDLLADEIIEIPPFWRDEPQLQLQPQPGTRKFHIFPWRHGRRQGFRQPEDRLGFFRPMGLRRDVPKKIRGTYLGDPRPGKRLQKTMERSTMFNGKIQISMVIFNSYLHITKKCGYNIPVDVHLLTGAKEPCSEKLCGSFKHYDAYLWYIWRSQCQAEKRGWQSYASILKCSEALTSVNKC